MCGIAGIFYFDGERSVTEAQLRRMTDVIVHRGPDDEGFFYDGPAGWGVRRLSIVDVKYGHQPLSNEDGSVWIGFNGEIYNHPDLYRELVTFGHRYRTHCDTETVVHAYEQWGEQMVERLCGMFAFALWDKNRRRLLLYRDRLGIKPLYYAVHDGALVFASEVKSLLEHGVPFAVNEEVLECYLRLGYVPGERTAFRGIHKLPPGHYLVAEPGSKNFSVQKYWDARYVPVEGRSEKSIREEFEQLLHTVIGQHRLGEVAQGIFLSGGVDSSAVVALTAEQVPEPSLTFSVGYADERDTSEFPFARLIAKQYATQHHEYELSSEGFADSLARLVWHMDEPVADPAAIPLFFIAQLARSRITVVHSGEGADEILAGYEIYKKMQFLGRLRSWGVASLARLVPGALWPYRFRRYVDLAALPLEERYQGVRQVFPAHLLRQVATSALHSANGNGYRRSVYTEAYGSAASGNDLNRMLYVDLKTWLPDDLLVKADKMTMAASLELRVPFLDHRVVEFAAQLPSDQKIRDGQSKFLLKQMMRGRLPDEILFAPKRGFPIPIAAWLRGSLRESAREWVLDSPFVGQFVERREVEKLLQAHADGRADFSPALYGLICLAVWHDVFSRKLSFAQRPAVARG